jgi:hypothetical protein
VLGDSYRFRFQGVQETAVCNCFRGYFWLFVCKIVP